MIAINSKSIMNWLFSVLLVSSLGGVMLSSISMQTVSAAACTGGDFLGFPAWYRGLDANTDCSIKAPGSGPNDLSNFIWHIGLNLVEIGLVAAAYISAFFILYGGFLFITSQGKPDSAAKARMTMLNAVIGLIISMVAVAAVEFVVKGLLG